MIRKRLAFTALAVSLGGLVGVGLGEVLLRSFWPQRSSVTLGMFEEDPEAGYRLRASYRNFVQVPEYRSQIRTDAQGYRIPDGHEPESGSGFRALAIGDSFTFGVGVDAEHAFPERLQERLNQGDSKAWEVRNGGVGGYGPLRSARLLLASQESWNPDLLVHAFYVGNDLEDCFPAGILVDPRIRDGRMVTAGQSALVRLRLYLRTTSHLYSFLRSRLYGLYQASPLAQASQYLDPIGRKQWTPWIRETSWPAAQAALREISDWSQERGVKYLVVLIPTRYQVEDAAWARYRSAWDLPEEEFDRDQAQRIVSDFLAEEDIPSLDLLPELRRGAAGGNRYYYEFDPHWSGDGHRQAARLIHERLEELGWISWNGLLQRDVVHAEATSEAG